MTLVRSVKAGRKPSRERIVRLAGAAIGVASLLLSGLTAPVLAEMRQVTLLVAMTCPASDPPVVEQLLLFIKGVENVQVAYEDQRAIVDFDDEKASVDGFIAALAEFGLEAEEVLPEASQ